MVDFRQKSTTEWLGLRDSRSTFCRKSSVRNYVPHRLEIEEIFNFFDKKKKYLIYKRDDSYISSIKVSDGDIMFKSFSGIRCLTHCGFQLLMYFKTQAH